MKKYYSYILAVIFCFCFSVSAQSLWASTDYTMDTTTKWGVSWGVGNTIEGGFSPLVTKVRWVDETSKPFGEYLLYCGDPMFRGDDFVQLSRTSEYNVEITAPEEGVLVIRYLKETLFKEVTQNSVTTLVGFSGRAKVILYTYTEGVTLSGFFIAPTVSATPTGIQPVTGVKTEMTDSSAKLSWTAPAVGTAAVGYIIQNSAGVEIGTSSSCSYTVTELSASTSYTFKVVAVDVDGNVSSSVSRTCRTLPPDMGWWDSDILCGLDGPASFELTSTAKEVINGGKYWTQDGSTWSIKWPVQNTDACVSSYWLDDNGEWVLFETNFACSSAGNQANLSQKLNPWCGGTMKYVLHTAGTELCSFQIQFR